MSYFVVEIILLGQVQVANNKQRQHTEPIHFPLLHCLTGSFKICLEIMSKTKQNKKTLGKSRSQRQIDCTHSTLPEEMGKIIHCILCFFFFLRAKCSFNKNNHCRVKKTVFVFAFSGDCKYPLIYLMKGINIL